MTFDYCFNELIDMQAHELSAHTIVSKKSAYAKHLRPIIGAMEMDDIKYPVLQSIINSMLKNGYAPKTAAHIRDIIRTTFIHAVRCGYTSQNPSLHIKVKRIDNRRFLQLTNDEIVRFVSAVKNEPDLFDRCLFMFLLHGRRANEARQLRWSWIDEKRKTVIIPALHSKDSQTHIYALSEEFLSLLPYLPRTSEFVFASRVTGSQFVDIRRPFRRILKRAGIDKSKMRIHDIRHLVGTVIIASGGSLEDVMYSLGHNSINTSKRYVTVDVSKSAASVSLVFGLSSKGGF
jgi:integrase